MGFLTFLSGDDHTTSLESRLLQEYTQGYILFFGYSPQKAAEEARKLLAYGKQEVARRGNKERPNFGTWMLQQEGKDERVSSYLCMVRSEGVRNDDILWWWNTTTLERVLMDKADEINRMAAFLSALEKKKTEDEAAEFMW